MLMLCVLRLHRDSLYFLKLLKRSGLSADDLLCFYKSVIRSVLEYGSVLLYGVITLHTLKVINSRPCKNVRSA